MAEIFSDPEVRFFQSLPGATLPTTRPRTIGGLLRKKGLKSKGKVVSLLSHADGYWEGWLSGARGARAWWNSEGCLKPPETWPEGVQELMPDHLTPSVWIDHVTPWGQGILGIRTWGPPGIEELSAHCLGWVLSPEQVRRAAAAAQDLFGMPLYVIWAYDLGLEGIPLPMTGTRDLRQKLAARAKVQSRPLLAGGLALLHALPRGMHDPIALLATCPRRSKGVSRTGKHPLTSMWRRHNQKAPRR